MQFDPTPVLAIIVIVAAVTAVLRGIEVRLSLFVAALTLGLISGDIVPIVRTFLTTFSSEKFVVPICSAMGFAYVLKHTGCDLHLVRLLMNPVRHVQWLMVPGVVLVGFLVNIPVISQTSTAVCIGTVVVPVMRAAGFTPAATGAALLLGVSVGGELLNPGAPELLTIQSTVRHQSVIDTREMMPYLLRVVLPQLVVSALVLWWIIGRPKASEAQLPNAQGSDDVALERVNPFKAMVPLVPLILLFISGPPLNWVSAPQYWVVNRPAEMTSAGLVGPGPAAIGETLRDPLYSTRMIGLAMLIGVGIAALASPRRSPGCMKAFFEGAGYGFTHIVSLIVIANCFGKGIEQVGIANYLGDWIANTPSLLHPLAAIVPASFAFVCGSGMAATQSLYGFFYGPAMLLDQDPISVGAMVSVGSAAGRTMSPVAAVVLMTAALTGTTPFELIKRVAPALIAGLAAVITLRLLALL